MTLLLACLAMIFCGILDFKDVFNYMGSTTVWMLISLGVAGEAIIQAGMLDAVGKFLQRHLGNNEKTMIVVLYSLAAVISCFINGLIVVIVFMSLVDKMVADGDGSITRKHIYYPVALGAGLGSLCTSIGSSAMMNVSAQLAASEYGRPFNLFDTFLPGFAATVAGLIFYLTFGYNLQKKVFTWDDIPPDIQKPLPKAARPKVNKEYSRSKRVLMILVLLWMIIMFATGLLNTGVTSVIGIVILILTGCIGEKAAWKAVDWQNCILVVGALGFGLGVSRSGAGAIIANLILNMAGSFADSAYAMCIVFLVAGMILSNFMANNSAAAIIVPIALNLAIEMGVSQLPFAIACGIGVNIAIATPVCRTVVTVTMPAGYSFRSMGEVGVVIQIIVTAAAAVALRVFFL